MPRLLAGTTSEIVGERGVLKAVHIEEQVQSQPLLLRMCVMGGQIVFECKGFSILQFWCFSQFCSFYAGRPLHEAIDGVHSVFILV